MPPPSRDEIQQALADLLQRFGAAYARAIDADGVVLGEAGDAARLSQPLPWTYLRDRRIRADQYAALRQMPLQPQMSGMGDTHGVHSFVAAGIMVSVYFDWPHGDDPARFADHLREMYAHAKAIDRAAVARFGAPDPNGEPQ